MQAQPVSSFEGQIGPIGDVPWWYQTVGTILAISSGFFIGMSLILQKKGLLDTTEIRISTGNEYAYLKSKLWWIGICCMVCGEAQNFMAYAFSPAIIVTPLGAISVVVSAILSVVFLGETLNFSGVCGILLCIIGSTIIVFNGPPSTATETIPEFMNYLIHPFFLTYFALNIILVLWLIFKVAPVYGDSQPVVYLTINSMGGAFLVNSAQGFGSSIVYSIRHWQDDNQFLKWELYVLGVFVICAAIFEIKYLNKALTHFSTSIVTPVSYVFFSTLTILTSAILFRGFNVSSFVQGGTIMAGFLVIVIGVALLFQYNLKLNKLKQELQRATSQATMDPVPDITDILDEPETDQNPISLMVATFPFRRAKRRTSNGYLDEFMTPTADVLPASQIEFRPPSAVASRKSPVADTTIEMSLSHPSSSTSSVPNRTDSADHLNNSNVSMMKLNEL